MKFFNDKSNGTVLTDEKVRAVLAKIQDPDLHRDIVSLGFVRNIEINGTDVKVTIQLPTPACPVKDQMKTAAEGYLREIGAQNVHVEMTSQVVGTANRNASGVLPEVKNTIAVA